MRILHINKFGWPKGGAEVYMLRLAEALRSSGDIVGIAAGPPISDSGPSFPIESPDFHSAKGVGRLRAAAHVMWSPTVSAAVGLTLDRFGPDVVHLHNWAHQFGPPVMEAIRKRGIASVATAHDYKLICPSYLAVRKEADCFRCRYRLDPVAFRDRCLHDSLSWSSVAVAESSFVRTRGLLPDHLIAPSQFLHQRFRDSWLSQRTRIRMIRNPIDTVDWKWRGGGEYLLYVGRLSAEKGVDRLVGLTDDLGIRLVVAGDGPERSALEAAAQDLRSDAVFLGHVDSDRLTELRMGCTAQVIPSQWPENAPLSLLESVSGNVPIVATDRGGLSELVEHVQRMALVKTWTSEAVRAALQYLSDTQVSPVSNSLPTWNDHVLDIRALYEEVLR